MIRRFPTTGKLESIRYLKIIRRFCNWFPLQFPVLSILDIVEKIDYDLAIRIHAMLEVLWPEYYDPSVVLARSDNRPWYSEFSLFPHNSCIEYIRSVLPLPLESYFSLRPCILKEEPHYYDNICRLAIHVPFLLSDIVCFTPEFFTSLRFLALVFKNFVSKEHLANKQTFSSVYYSMESSLHIVFAYNILVMKYLLAKSPSKETFSYCHHIFIESPVLLTIMLHQGDLGVSLDTFFDHVPSCYSALTWLPTTVTNSLNTFIKSTVHEESDIIVLAWNLKVLSCLMKKYPLPSTEEAAVFIFRFFYDNIKVLNPYFDSYPYFKRSFLESFQDILLAFPVLKEKKRKKLIYPIISEISVFLSFIRSCLFYLL